MNGAVPCTLNQATFYTYLCNWLGKHNTMAEYNQELMFTCMYSLVHGLQRKDTRNKKLEDYFIEQGTQAVQVPAQKEVTLNICDI